MYFPIDMKAITTLRRGRLQLQVPVPVERQQSQECRAAGSRVMVDVGTPAAHLGRAGNLTRCLALLEQSSDL